MQASGRPGPAAAVYFNPLKDPAGDCSSIAPVANARVISLVAVSVEYPPELQPTPTLCYSDTLCCRRRKQCGNGDGTMAADAALYQLLFREPTR